MKALAALLLCGLASVSTQARDLGKEHSTAKLKIGEKIIEAYVADTEAKREKGLMHVTAIPENQGMIFVFEDEQPLAFWMKNTLIPLSIGYFNNKAELIDIQEMSVPSLMEERPPNYPSKAPARLALEMNKGWFSRHRIKVGAKLSLVSPTRSSALNAVLVQGRARP